MEGRLQTRAWKSQDGNDRTVTEIVIEEMMALGNPKNAGGNSYEHNAPTSYVRNDDAPATTNSNNSPAEEIFSADNVKETSKDILDEIPF